MLSRLDWMTLKPKVVVDMSCRAGEMSVRLNTYYQEADVIAVDESEDMLQYAKKTSSLNMLVCAEGEKLPFANQSVDLIFANLLISWHADISALLREWRRILRKDGMLMLTALGLDTLKECQDLFKPDEMPYFMDMHNIGDLLLQEKFADPVLDVNYYTMSYSNPKHLLNELRASGMWFPQDQVNIEKMETSLRPNALNAWEVTYEVIYAHAFIPANVDENILSSDGTIRVPLETLRQTLKKK